MLWFETKRNNRNIGSKITTLLNWKPALAKEGNQSRVLTNHLPARSRKDADAVGGCSGWRRRIGRRKSLGPERRLPGNQAFLIGYLTWAALNIGRSKKIPRKSFEHLNIVAWKAWEVHWSLVSSVCH